MKYNRKIKNLDNENYSEIIKNLKLVSKRINEFINLPLSEKEDEKKIDKLIESIYRIPNYIESYTPDSFSLVNEYFKTKSGYKADWDENIFNSDNIDLKKCSKYIKDQINKTNIIQYEIKLNKYDKVFVEFYSSIKEIMDNVYLENICNIYSTCDYCNDEFSFECVDIDEQSSVKEIIDFLKRFEKALRKDYNSGRKFNRNMIKRILNRYIRYQFNEIY